MLREYFLGNLHLIRDKKLQPIKSYGLNKHTTPDKRLRGSGPIRIQLLMPKLGESN